MIQLAMSKAAVPWPAILKLDLDDFVTSGSCICSQTIVLHSKDVYRAVVDTVRILTGGWIPLLILLAAARLLLALCTARDRTSICAHFDRLLLHTSLHVHAINLCLCIRCRYCLAPSR